MSNHTNCVHLSQNGSISSSKITDTITCSGTEIVTYANIGEFMPNNDLLPAQNFPLGQYVIGETVPSQAFPPAQSGNISFTPYIGNPFVHELGKPIYPADGIYDIPGGKMIVKRIMSDKKQVEEAQKELGNEMTLEEFDKLTMDYYDSCEDRDV